MGTFINYILVFLLLLTHYVRGPLIFFLKMLFKLLFRLEIKGIENIPKKENFILVSNHQSYLDAILISLYIGQPMYYFVLNTIYDKIPKFIRTRINCIPVSRNPLNNFLAIDMSLHLLNTGKSLCIFPEGYRTTDGKMHTFKSGFAYLHKTTKVQLLPVHISGAFEAWPRQNTFPTFTKIKVQYFPTLKS